MGDQVVVDGLQGRGVIIARKDRRLTIQFRNGLTLSRDQMFVHPIASYYKSRYGSMAAGGAGSGCNPEVGKCGRPPIGHTITVTPDKVGIREVEQEEISDLAKKWKKLGKSEQAKAAARLVRVMTEHYNTTYFATHPKYGIVAAMQMSGVYHKDTVPWVEYLSVHPDIIDKKIPLRGIGTQMMLHAAKIAAERGSGLKLVGLEMSKYKASPFYEKLGMHRKGPEDPIYSWSPDEVKAFAKHGGIQAMDDEEVAKRIRAAIAEEENTAPLACRKDKKLEAFGLKMKKPHFGRMPNPSFHHSKGKHGHFKTSPSLSPPVHWQKLEAGGPGSGCKGENCGRKKEEVEKAINQVRQQWGSSSRVKCPFCGWESNGRLLRGNFTGVRDTRIPAVVKHIQKYHSPEIKADAGGEPDVGNYSHSHMEPGVFIYQPPSLRNKRRVPTDDPMEKDDKYLDVTKRKAKDTQRQRDELLKHDAPAGNPPLIPARTTLLAPHMGIYQPLLASRVIQRPARVIGAKATKISYQGRK